MEKRTEKKKNRQKQNNNYNNIEFVAFTKNVANFDTDNFLLLMAKIWHKKILGRNRNINYFCLSFQRNTSGLKFVTYQTNRCSQWVHYKQKSFGKFYFLSLLRGLNYLKPF